MRILKVFGPILLAVLFNGCALLQPPTAGWSTTKIVKDAKGEIVESQYTRKVFGGIPDKEDVGTWSSADDISRSSLGKSTINSRTLYPGIVENKSRRPISIKITGPVTRSYMLDAREKIDDELPAGAYNATAWDGERKVGWHDFRVVPGTEHFYNKQKVSWYYYQAR
ncbi:MAG: hypothetical protein WCG01_00275 [bacterium]